MRLVEGSTSKVWIAGFESWVSELKEIHIKSSWTSGCGHCACEVNQTRIILHRVGNIFKDFGRSRPYPSLVHMIWNDWESPLTWGTFVGSEWLQFATLTFQVISNVLFLLFPRGVLNFSLTRRLVEMNKLYDRKFDKSPSCRKDVDKNSNIC